MPHNTRTPSHPGGRLGAYKIHYLLGFGGFGVVYLGEQIYGKPEPASDQYALAIAVYEWLTGHLPFDGDRKIAIVYKHLHVQPPSMRLRHPSIPAAVEKVVMKALHKDPLRRYVSITAFAETLEEAANNKPDQAANNKQATRNSIWHNHHC